MDQEQRKSRLLLALGAFAKRRPNIGAENYGGFSREYRADVRAVGRDRRDALALLSHVARRSISADDIISASRNAFSGRLEISECDDSVRIEYTPGQFYPMEFRAAVCSVLAYALRVYWLAQYPRDDGARAIAELRRELGRSLARWIS